MKIYVKNPAPMLDGDTRWGDDYFGRSLASALEREGCTVEQEFWPDWVSEPQDGAVIVLRGLRAWTPPKSGFHILWILSHPTQVSAEELEGYDLVLVGSRLHAKLLSESTRVPVEVAMQCTDTQLFKPPESSIEEQAQAREGIVYVANTRGILRDMAQFVLETGHPADVYGRGWQYYDLDHYVRQEHIPNSMLPEIYRAARIGLNDHWLDMRALGYVNNRLLDSLSCGLPTITDDVPEVRELFGDALLYAGSGREFSAAVAYSDTHYASLLERIDRKWAEVASAYTFANRAAEIVQWINNPPKAGRPEVFDALGALARSTAESLVATVKHEEQRAAFLERERKRLSRELGEAKSELSGVACDARLSQERLTKLREELRAAIANCGQASQQRAKGKASQRVAETPLGERDDLVADLHACCDALREERDRVERQLESVLRSTSWRVTAVMRAAKIALYSKTGKNRPGRVRLADLPQRPGAASAGGDRAQPGATSKTQTSKNPEQVEDLADYWRAQAYALLQELEAMTLRHTAQVDDAQDVVQGLKPVAWNPPVGE